MNSSGEIAFLSLFLLQLFLTVLLIWIILKRTKDPSINIPMDRHMAEDSIVSFSKNCKKYFLTSREIEILKLVSDGLPYKIIASQLNISEYTVGTHVKNMFSKVNATNKMELVRKITN